MPALLTSLQSVWLNQPPQASSDYLSVQLGCSAAQGNLCYVNNNHTCSTTSTPGERDSSPPEQEGLILSKTEIDLPPTTSLLPRSTADPPPLPPPPRRQKSEHCSSSGQRVKTTKSTQWKKARGSCKMPEGSEENPRGAEDLASTSRAATTNPQKNSLTVIPLKPLYQRDGPSQGET